MITISRYSVSLCRLDLNDCVPRGFLYFLQFEDSPKRYGDKSARLSAVPFFWGLASTYTPPVGVARHYPVNLSLTISPRQPAYQTIREM